MSKKRDEYVDIVKGVCIILVVFSHINLTFSNTYGIYIYEYINKFINQIFLSVFFIISGFYIKDMDNYKSFFKNKVWKNYLKLIRKKFTIGMDIVK